MSEHQDDIDFDFFGEPEPAPPKRRLVRRPSGPPPGGPAPPGSSGAGAPGASPFFRLISAVVFVIAVVLILVFAVRSCQASNQNSAYKSYIDQVQAIGRDSESVGGQLSTLMARTDLTEKALETRLQGLIDQQMIGINKAKDLTPPGPLRQQQEYLLEALQLRSDGLGGLLRAFRATPYKRGSAAQATASQVLSSEMRVMAASDVVWNDLFVTQTRSVLEKKGITGLAPHLSSIFFADPDVATRNNMGRVWTQLHGVATGPGTSSGTHGTNIEYVKVLPSGKILRQGETSIISLSQNLAFEVRVHNGGDFLEQDVKVTFVIQQRNHPIRRVATISKIYNGTSDSVTFGSPFDLTVMVNVVNIKVDVAPVVGETNTANNSYTYQVRFSYG